MTYLAIPRSFCTVGSVKMSFILDKEQVKQRPIFFRRCDVGHDNYYYRFTIQNKDRYKTISLRAADRQAARILVHGTGVRERACARQARQARP